MIPYREALESIQEIALAKRKFLTTEKVSLLKSVSKISSRSVRSEEQIPSFDNSAMDGFALRSSQTLSASEAHPLNFEVLGSLAAGDQSVGKSSASLITAYEIMTGGPIPESYDCCVKIEDCEVVKNLRGDALSIRIRAPLAPKTNLREAGHDFKIGSVILNPGDSIMPEHVLALSSLGINELEIYSPIRIALIATGKELVRFEETPKPWQIRNSTQPYLQLALDSWPATIEKFLLSDDSKDEFKNLVRTLSEKKFDLIITTGAVSMGQFDFVAEALNELKAKTHFHKVAIRPGKPILFAELGQTTIFSLPGNPVSSVVGFRFFIESFLQTLFSKSKEKPMRAQLQKDLEKPKGLKLFLKARLDLTDMVPKVEILEGQMSSMVSSLLEANSWVVLDEEISSLKNQDFVNVFTLHSQGFVA